MKIIDFACNSNKIYDNDFSNNNFNRMSGLDMNRECVVDGFSFESEDVLAEAKKEQDGVRYMKAHMDLEHPEKVLQIYQKMIEQQMFQTAVGRAYLRELQDYLHTMPQIRNDQIPPIPVGDTIRVVDASGTTDALRKENEKSRKAFRWSVAINCIAAAVIVVMFAIAASSSSPTILNYENKLIDKYSEWEQQLDERENAIREKEGMIDGDND